jgi:biotin carboxylase
MSTVFLVQSEPGYWVRTVAGHVRESGRSPVLLTAPLTDAQRLAAAETVDGIVELEDITDPEALAAAVRARDADGRIMTCADTVMVAAAQAAELLDVAHVPASVLENIRNKYAARRIMADAGLSSPRFALLHSAEDAAAVADAVGLPAIVKPVNGAGSHSVRGVNTVDELAAAYREMAEHVPGSIRGLYDRPFGALDPTRSFLVEGRLDGVEHVVELVVRDGATVWTRSVAKPIVDDVFREPIMMVPALDLPGELERALLREAEGAVHALGLRDGVAHVELIDDKLLGPTVVEVNGSRPGGGILAVMHELNSGMRLFAETLAATLGEPRPPRTEPKIAIPVASATVFADGAGRYIGAHGLDEVAELPEVLDVIPGAQPGQILGGDYEVYAVNVLLAGFTSEAEVLDLYKEILGRVRLEIEPLEIEPVEIESR